MDVLDNIGNRLLEIQKQRDALMGRAINLKLDADGMDQARQAVQRTRTETAGLMKDLGGLGNALTDKAVAPMAQYGQLAGAALQASRAMGAGLVTALRGASGEFQKQKDLAAFWGTSGYMHLGLQNFRNGLSSFLASGGAGFRGWLQNVSTNLTQYRTALAGAAAVMVGFAAAAGLSSKHAQNYIKSTFASGLMQRKLSDQEGAEKWVESAQGVDWSAGRESRMGTFHTLLARNPYMGQKGAQKATEDIEKYFFKNQEMLQKAGVTSAEQLAEELSSTALTQDRADVLGFNLGFASKTAQARLGAVAEETKGYNMADEVNMRPDEVLTKRLTATTQAMGDAVIPVLNTVLGAFIKLSDVIGKIPGLGKAMAWGTMLAGAAAAGLIVVSMIGSLIPGLMTVIGLFTKMGVVTKLAAAGQWLLNAAMTANPLGIAIVAIAGLVAGLYLLEKKFGIVTKAMNAIRGSNIFKGLSEAFKGGGLKMAMEVLAAGSPAFKIFMLMLDYIKRLWVSGDALKKLFSIGLGYWQKMIEFFNWLLNSIKNGVQWVKDGLGITKAEKKAEMDKVAEREGLHWNENKQAWFTKEGAESSPSAMLAKAQAEYDKTTPGIFGSIPGISDLTAAIKSLADALKNPVKQSIINPVQKLTTQINPVGTTAEFNAASILTSNDIQYDIAAGVYSRISTGEVVSDDVVRSLLAAKSKPSMDVGGSVISNGLITAHRGEEVDRAATVNAGKTTTLDKINSLISGSGSQRDFPVSISAPVSVHVSVGSLSSDMDIDRLAHRIGTEGAQKLLFAIRNQLNSSGSRDIAYLRG